MEEHIRAGIESSDEGMDILLSPRDVEEICSAIETETRKLAALGHLPIVLVSPSIRPALKQLTAAHLPQLVVLGYNEITRDTKIESVGMVSEAEAVGSGSRQPAVIGNQRSSQGACLHVRRK